MIRAEEQMPRLVAEPHAQFAESAKLEQAIMRDTLLPKLLSGELSVAALGQSILSKESMKSMKGSMDPMDAVGKTDGGGAK